MRLDLRLEIFPKAWSHLCSVLCSWVQKTCQQDVAVFDNDDTIWAYAIPDRQWIAMPDRLRAHLPHFWGVAARLKVCYRPAWLDA